MRIFRRNRSAAMAVDVDAALRQLWQLHDSGRVTLAGLHVAGLLRSAVPAPREARSAAWEMVDEGSGEVLVRCCGPELDLGTVRRMASALAHRLGRPLRVTYTATSTFTPTTEEA